MLCAFFALTAPASAGTLARGNGVVLPPPVVSYSAAPGEANTMKLEPAGDRWVLHENSAGVTTKDPCVPADGYTTFQPYCPSDGLTGAEISLGDRDDSADLSAISLPVVVSGGAGHDRITT